MSRLKGKEPPGRVGTPLAVVHRMALLIALLGATGEVGRHDFTGRSVITYARPR